LDPEIELDVVAAGPRPANYRYAITNSFGIGANKVAAVFGAY
jgi:3-oxoacyl-(acyl-carrier-protein) synthase